MVLDKGLIGNKSKKNPFMWRLKSDWISISNCERYTRIFRIKKIFQTWKIKIIKEPV
jgi:hypothetical protein